jgi:hypothetical protein
MIIGTHVNPMAKNVAPLRNQWRQDLERTPGLTAARPAERVGGLNWPMSLGPIPIIVSAVPRGDETRDPRSLSIMPSLPRRSISSDPPRHKASQASQAGNHGLAGLRVESTAWHI